MAPVTVPITSRVPTALRNRLKEYITKGVDDVSSMGTFFTGVINGV